MRLRSLMLVTLLAATLLITSAFAAVSIFATGMDAPEAIAPTAAGNFLVTDARADGPIWSVPAAGGTATQVASAGYSLRDGVFLPASFGSVGGQFLVVGGDGTLASASTMDASNTVSPYASQANSLWNTPVVASGFGRHNGEVLVTNQGSGTGDGSVDIFTPSGTVGRLANLPSVNVPFGAAQAPAGFGPLGGTLLVSDGGGGGIYSVNPTGRVSLFATIPLGTGQNGLRQIAFAPSGWGRYSGDLFVSLNTRDIVIVSRNGSIIGRISGTFNPRGLRFTTLAGNASLLFSDVSMGVIQGGASVARRPAARGQRSCRSCAMVPARRPAPRCYVRWPVGASGAGISEPGPDGGVSVREVVPSSARATDSSRRRGRARAHSIRRLRLPSL
jgi:hypothetical protein